MPRNARYSAVAKNGSFASLYLASQQGEVVGPAPKVIQPSQPAPTPYPNGNVVRMLKGG